MVTHATIENNVAAVDTVEKVTPSQRRTQQE